MNNGEWLCIFGPYAATEEEGCFAFIGFEHIPIELLAIATHALAFGVEEEQVGYSFVGFRLLEIGWLGNVERFNNR